MTEEEAKRIIAFMNEHAKKTLRSRKAIRKWLIECGAETEESMRKHDEEIKKRRKKK